MGYLDELKQQADALSRRQRVDAAGFERHAAATEAACKTAFQYWLELSRQLNVLRPPAPSRYVLDARHVLDGPADGLRFDDFRVDARRKQLRNLDVHDHVVIGCWLRGGREMALVKDFPPEMERLEARLAQAGIVTLADPQRDPATGRFRAAHYRFEADVRVTVRLLPDHEQGRVQFAARNLDGLSTLFVEFDAVRVDAALLDELAKWWLGEPNGFVAAGRIVRIVDPR